MSELESINGSEIEVASNNSITSIEYDRESVKSTESNDGAFCINDENEDTFVQTQRTVAESVENWPPSIRFVRDEFITYELCEKAVQQDGCAIFCIKRNLVTEEQYYTLCLDAVRENGWCLNYIPEEVQTQELCDAALHSSCWSLPYCLDRFKTYENCLSSVERNGQTIEKVPQTLITYEMCLAGVKSRYPCLHLIPKEFITQEICDEAVKANGENIKGVPEEFMSTSLAMLSLKSPDQHSPNSKMAGSNIRYISAKFLTKEIIVESVKLWSCTYSTVPKECRTKEVEDAALLASPYCIKYMEQTKERCWQALKSDLCVLNDYIDKENITREMAEYVLTQDYNRRLYDETIEFLESLV
jgi:hypothetical protein